MGRSAPNFLRAIVIACACAILFLTVRAHAQSTNNDGYGLTPIPGLPQTTMQPGDAQMQPGDPQGGFTQAPPGAVPRVPVQQAPMMPVQVSGPAQNYNGTPPPNYGAPTPNYNASTGPQSLAPNAPPYGQVAFPYMPPPATVLRTGQNPSATLPYGYVPLPGAAASNPASPNPASPNPQAAPAAPSVAVASNTAGENLYTGYRLGPGDKVRVNVFGEEDLSGEYQVDGSGLVRLPLIGTVRAGGNTAPGLGVAIANALSPGYLKNPKVNVEITLYRPFYIIGAVNRPGEYPYVNNMTALDAVALGGGFTDKARESTIYVRHEGSPEEEGMPAGQLTRIYPGDVVRIKTTTFWDAMDMISPIAGPAAIAAAAF
jgi:polysaccharide export outer membrane protein